MTQVKRSYAPPIPTPELILMGCQAWDARTPSLCPVCRGGVHAGHDRTYCGRCDSTSPAVETRVLAARRRVVVRVEIEVAEREAGAALHRWQRTGPQLTESERRRIWLGYSAEGVHSKNPQVVNRAKVGRDWLRAIGQIPDWTLKLDRHGRIVGRHDEPRNPEDAPRKRGPKCPYLEP